MEKVCKKKIFMYYVFIFLLIWFFILIIKKFLLKLFKCIYFNIVCIIDCIEFFIQKFRFLIVQFRIFSSYKYYNIYKVFIGIMLLGVIIFVLNLWGGNIFDRYIMKFSGFFDFVKLGYEIMVDWGFLI